MKLIIEIPKEFEVHWIIDCFEDSLHRLSADAHLLAGNYEQEIAKMLIKALKNAEPWKGEAICGKRGINVPADKTNYCPNCGAEMRGDNT